MIKQGTVYCSFLWMYYLYDLHNSLAHLFFALNVIYASVMSAHNCPVKVLSIEFVFLLLSSILLTCTAFDDRHSGIYMFLLLKHVGFKQLMWIPAYLFMCLLKLPIRKLNSTVKQVSVRSLLAASRNVLL